MKRDDIKRAAGQREEDRAFEAVSQLPGTRVFRNAYIPCGRGRTAELDVLVLSSKGLWAIEVKGFGGTITGSATRYEWTRRYKRKGSRPEVVTKMFNPTKQSDGHLKAIQRYLGIPAEHVHGIVVFSDTALLQKVPRTPSCDVLNTRFLSSHLRRSLAKRKPCFSPAEFSRLEERLDALATTDAIKLRHIVHARRAELARKAEQEQRRSARQKPRSTYTPSKQ